MSDASSKEEQVEANVLFEKSTSVESAAVVASGEEDDDLDAMRFGSRIPEVKEQTPGFFEAGLDEGKAG